LVIESKPLNEEAPFRLDEDTLQQIIREDAGDLTNSLTELDMYRDYYEGDQALNFSTQEFTDTFGTTFADLRSNWMTVIIEAMEERLDVQRVRMRNAEGNPEEELSDQIWAVFLQNELEQLQNDIYNGALIEGRSYALIWPNELTGVPRIDFQPAQNLLVTYHPEDLKVIDRAVKRWVTPDGGQRLTIYTADFLYKYKLDPTGGVDPDDVTPRDTGWQVFDPADSGDPSWPLPNPFGEVPIVEFWNRSHRSELRDVIPLQDGLNKTLRDMIVANEYQAQNVIYIVTSNEEPEGGWKASPGTVWHIQPEVDFEGNALPVQVGTIDASNPEVFIVTIETFLQHIAAISRTPAHYFYLSSKQGGRGDAPSGEALRVAETGLLKKVQKSQQLWGLRWLRVARLVAMALGNFDPEVPLTGETVWTHPMAHFKSILLEEGRQMISDLGLPPQIAWRHIGLTEEEIREAEAEGFDRNRDESEKEQEGQNPDPAQSSPANPASME
jgi:hypothetical protein